VYPDRDGFPPRKERHRGPDNAIGQVTDFLKGKSELPPFPIKALNRPK
jgi:hypothetical protein